MKSIAVKKEEELVERLASHAESIIPKKQQRIRATVSLSKAGHDAVKELSDSKEIKNAEVFKSILDASEFIKEMDVDLGSDAKNDTERIRKTYVVDKDTLLRLAKVAKELNHSRDSLIDRMSRFLVATSEKISQEKIQQYTEYYKRVQALLHEAEKIEVEIEDALGEDDPFFSDFNQMVGHMHHWTMEMSDHIPQETPAGKE